MIVQTAPEAVKIDGIIYKLNTYWFDCLSIIRAFEDNNIIEIPELGIYEKSERLIENLYGISFYEFNQNHLNKALELGVKFLDGGMSKKNEKQGKPEKRLYSFNKDWEHIYSAILTMNNGIDLYKAHDLHWWTFIAYLMGAIEQENFFSKLISLRARYYKNKLTKEERVECENIGWDTIILDTPDMTEHEMYERFLNGE